MDRYWTEKRKARVYLARNYTKLWWVARDILRSMPAGVVQVCGPISTGGTGSRELNCQVFALAIEYLKKKGLTVFDQMPFQDQMVGMSKRYAEKNNGAYDQSLLEEFYRPLFQSGFITETHFLPGWEDSTGAKWERELITSLGIPIQDFPKRTFTGLVKKAHALQKIVNVL